MFEGATYRGNGKCISAVNIDFGAGEQRYSIGMFISHVDYSLISESFYRLFIRKLEKKFGFKVFS